MPFGLFGDAKPTVIGREDALPGRDEELSVAARHAVLGTPVKGPWPEGSEVLYVGMGCFWGAERIFWRIPGVHVTAVGYMGGWTRNPTYPETCTGRTGHTEAVMVVYDPGAVDLEALLKAFWENHDPTTADRQGNDVGTQYRSALYLTSEAQLATAEASRDRYQQALHDAGFGTITTEVRLAEDAGDGRFYYAEEDHQAYLHKQPYGYCNHGFCQVAYDAEAHGQGPAARAALPDA